MGNGKFFHQSHWDCDLGIAPSMARDRSPPPIAHCRYLFGWPTTGRATHAAPTRAMTMKSADAAGTHRRRQIEGGLG